MPWDTLAQSIPNAGDMFLEGFAENHSYCYFLISYFFQKFGVTGPSILIF